MYSKRYITFLFFVFILLCWKRNVYAQQLKLGNNPTSIEKSSVLQLDSKNQGLLLTRLADTSAINIMNPSDGMLIYLTKGPNTGIYERRNGGWRESDQIFQTIHETGKIKFTTSNDTVTLNIPNASDHTGVVSTTSSGQTFHGDKIFQDSLVSLSGFSSYSDARIDDGLILKKITETMPGYLLSTDVNGKALLQTHPDTWIVGGNTIATGGTNTLGTLTNTELPVITNSKDRLHITSDGKVGINNPSPIDTLDVKGSFKLGRNGSSFGRMGTGVTNSISFGGDLIKLLGTSYTYLINTFTINGVKKNAQIFVNPTSDLYAENKLTITLPIVGTVIVVGLSTIGANIMWARAIDSDKVEIAIRIIKDVPILSIASILTPTITTKFDVLYCNPQ